MLIKYRPLGIDDMNDEDERLKTFLDLNQTLNTEHFTANSEPAYPKLTTIVSAVRSCFTKSPGIISLTCRKTRQ